MGHGHSLTSGSDCMSHSSSVSSKAGPARRECVGEGYLGNLDWKDVNIDESEFEIINPDRNRTENQSLSIQARRSES